MCNKLMADRMLAENKKLSRMNNQIIEASQLPESEQVYLKKDWSGWRVVEPYKDENGKIIWKKLLLGTKKGLISLIIYLLIAVMLYFGIKQLISNYQLIADNPCKYCIDCFKKDVIPINLTLK